MKTHVEFRNENGNTVVMPRSCMMLVLDHETDKECPNGVFCVHDSRDWPESGFPISPETAARLRRELLGEGEAEAKGKGDPMLVELTEDEFRAVMRGERILPASLNPAPPTDPAPLVVTGPGVYRDASGWGRRVVGRREDGRWYGESLAGERSATTWDNAGTADSADGDSLVARVADLSTWRLDRGATAAMPDELAAMLTASKPAVEPEFVLARLMVETSGGGVAGTYHHDERAYAAEIAERLSGRVVKLFIRREDARP